MQNSTVEEPNFTLLLAGQHDAALAEAIKLFCPPLVSRWIDRPSLSSILADPSQVEESKLSFVLVGDDPEPGLIEAVRVVREASYLLVVYLSTHLPEGPIRAALYEHACIVIDAAGKGERSHNDRMMAQLVGTMVPLLGENWFFCVDVCDFITLFSDARHGALGAVTVPLSEDADTTFQKIAASPMLAGRLQSCSGIYMGVVSGECFELEHFPAWSDAMYGLTGRGDITVVSGVRIGQHLPDDICNIIVLAVW